MSLVLGRLFPRSTDLTETQRRLLATGVLILAAATATIAVNALTVFCGAHPLAWLTDWGPAGIYVPATFMIALRAWSTRSHRLSWILFAIGVGSYGIATILYAAVYVRQPDPPMPSIADALWVAFYPCAYVAFTIFVSSERESRPGLRVLLDAVVAGAGVASLGAAVILPRVFQATSATGWAKATILSYPLGDLLFAGLLVGIIGLRGWRIARVWGLMASAAVILTAADCLYTVQFAGGADQVTAATNLLYAIAFGLFALAPWQRAPAALAPTYTRWTVFLVPSGFSVAAILLLVYNRVDPVNGLAFWLAALTSIAALVRMAAAFRDARQLSEARHQALTDDLTGLPNRRAFVARVERGIGGGGTVAVLMLDLDNFKQLNDTLGHRSGDQLVRMIGPRLSTVPAQLLARLGGDEFAIVLDPAPDRDGVIAVAERILQTLTAPFDVHGVALRVMGSVGVATSSSQIVDAEELMRQAEIAMYQAKTARIRYDIYDCERDTHSRERLALSAQFGSALDEGRIDVYFQPKVEMQSHRIVGVEALVRWRHQDGSLRMPAEFIAAAEHTGLSRQLTAYVIDRSLAQVRVWRDAGQLIHVAVNTTVSDLVDTRFPGEVRMALMRHRLPPDALVLEITETALMTDPERIDEVLRQLGALGIELSLDDFGTGYSSLAHLKTLPVGEIKIDRSFVSRMTTDDTDAAIVSATITLAQRLGVRVTAEGVEDQACWDALSRLDCDVVQGYLISRPVPARELDRLMGWQRQPDGDAQAAAAAEAVTTGSFGPPGTVQTASSPSE